MIPGTAWRLRAGPKESLAPGSRRARRQEGDGIRRSGLACQGQGVGRSSGDATAMHEEIARHRDRIAEICRSRGVARLETFGSAARGTDFDPTASDVDFLVECESPDDRRFFERHSGLQDELAAALEREVDLVSALPDNRYLLASVNACRELVFEA